MYYYLQSGKREKKAIEMGKLLFKGKNEEE